LDHRAIILRFNEIARGYAGYYSFVDNYGDIASVINFTLLHSCAKTLARKFNLNSRASVFAKFGKKLTPKDDLTKLVAATSKSKRPKLVEFLSIPNYKKTRQFKLSSGPLLDPLKVLS